MTCIYTDLERKLCERQHDIHHLVEPHRQLLRWAALLQRWPHDCHRTLVWELHCQRSNMGFRYEYDHVTMATVQTECMGNLVSGLDDADDEAEVVFGLFHPL